MNAPTKPPGMWKAQLCTVCEAANPIADTSTADPDFIEYICCKCIGDPNAPPFQCENRSFHGTRCGHKAATHLALEQTGCCSLWLCPDCTESPDRACCAVADDMHAEKSRTT